MKAVKDTVWTSTLQNAIAIASGSGPEEIQSDRAATDDLQYQCFLNWSSVTPLPMAAVDEIPPVIVINRLSAYSAPLHYENSPSSETAREKRRGGK
jgi:hypothetical protein